MIRNLKPILLWILLVLLVVRYAVDWIEEAFEWIMKPIDRLIKMLSVVTGLKVSGEDLRRASANYLQGE